MVCFKVYYQPLFIIVLELEFCFRICDMVPNRMLTVLICYTKCYFLFLIVFICIVSCLKSLNLLHPQNYPPQSRHGNVVFDTLKRLANHSSFFKHFIFLSLAVPFSVVGLFFYVLKKIMHTLFVLADYGNKIQR